MIPFWEMKKRKKKKEDFSKNKYGLWVEIQKSDHLDHSDFDSHSLRKPLINKWMNNLFKYGNGDDSGRSLIFISSVSNLLHSI